METIKFEFLVHNSRVTEEAHLLGYDALSSGESSRRVERKYLLPSQRSKILVHITLENEGDTFFRNVGNHSLDAAASQW